MVDADYDTVFRAEHDAIVRSAFLVTGDRETAREVAQEAFAELHRHWRKVRHYDRPGAWLRRVAIRKAVRVKQRRPDVGVLPDDLTSAGPEVDVGAATLDVLRALRRLSPSQRAAIVLHYFEDRPVGEVAEALGCKPATASVHLHRARNRLAELLGEEVETDVPG
ncbi:MAG TPA: sigma-70 family RNA polymerase sigma factor [Acidimicrobiales bacterium]|nr:sigma-70 family RNA polymerase sigma factor [Acidimicrobiales bacterium]